VGSFLSRNLLLVQIFILPFVKKHVTTIRIAIILAIALFGVLVISAVAVAPHAYASGGLMSLVAHGAQDVYLTGNNPLREEVPGLGGNNTGTK
jgi:hypothetical protein